MVGCAARPGPRARDPDPLRALGGIPGQELSGGGLPLAAVFAAHHGRLVPVLARVPHSPPTGAVPRHLLLLSQGVLPLLLSRSAGVRRQRVPWRRLSWRDG